MMYPLIVAIVHKERSSSEERGTGQGQGQYSVQKLEREAARFIRVGQGRGAEMRRDEQV